jgi:prolyl oligopeptidase
MRRLLPCLFTVAAGCSGGSHKPVEPVTQTASPPAATEPAAAPPAVALTYPATQRGPVVDDYHGTKVADPYRWLEDTESAETRAWIEAQNHLTFGFLEAIPERRAITDRLTALWNYEKYGLPTLQGGRYFYTRNDGLQNQAVLYWSPTLDGEPKVLLDPNALSKDGTVALSSYAISEDGRHLAYGLASAGSDWIEWKVREVESGKDTSDRVQWSKFSGASWTRDGAGFYYSRYPEPKPGQALLAENVNQEIWYHRLGTPQGDDQLVYQRPDQPKWSVGGAVTEDGRYLLAYVSKGTGPQNLLLVQDLKGTTAKKRSGKLRPLIDAWEAEYSVLGNDGPVLYVKTDLAAPRGRIIAIDLRKPKKAQWKELVPQSAQPIAGATIVGDQLFIEYMADARSVVRVHALDGKHLRDVDLPGIGSAAGFVGERKDRETFYSFTSYTEASSVYRYDLATGKSEVWRRPKVDFDAGAYETRQVFYTSRDGTKVPMFVTHRKGMTPDGDAPTILYGYGGFSISLTPSFSPAFAVFLERGGVVAVPNLRGGGEYGEEWHLAGTKLTKQNVFDDFIAAAEWLIANKITRPAKLAIQGGSNGGLLVGACMTQRPELFGAAVPAVGVLDMLRFHKFTIGWAWVDDYGSSEDAKEFAALHAYSPYHRLVPGTAYPPTLILTGDHDDRVVPGHSFKFAAALQHAHKGANPVLIRIETRAGHGAGKPTTMKIAESADTLAFLSAVFGRANATAATTPAAAATTPAAHRPAPPAGPTGWRKARALHAPGPFYCGVGAWPTLPRCRCPSVTGAGQCSRCWGPFTGAGSGEAGAPA